jgi:hypothetical protein
VPTNPMRGEGDAEPVGRSKFNSDEVGKLAVLVNRTGVSVSGQDEKWVERREALHIGR